MTITTINKSYNKLHVPLITISPKHGECFFEEISGRRKGERKKNSVRNSKMEKNLVEKLLKIDSERDMSGTITGILYIIGKRCQCQCQINFVLRDDELKAGQVVNSYPAHTHTHSQHILPPFRRLGLD